MSFCASIAAIGLHMATISTPGHWTTSQTVYNTVKPAQGALGLQWYSMTTYVKHSYQEATPGLYVRCDSGMELGVYRNSEGRLSGHLGYLKGVKVHGPLSAYGRLSAETGYRGRSVTIRPEAGARLALSDRLALRAGYAPKLTGVNDTHQLRFSLEWRP